MDGALPGTSLERPSVGGSWYGLAPSRWTDRPKTNQERAAFWQRSAHTVHSAHDETQTHKGGSKENITEAYSTTTTLRNGEV